MLLNIEMNVDRAKYLINKKFPNRKPVRVIELSDVLIFDTIPKEISRRTKTEYDTTIAVNKNTGSVYVFNPLIHATNEYNLAIENNKIKPV